MTVTENMQVVQEITSRIAAILDDIHTIEGGDEEDILELEERLRTEFSEDPDVTNVSTDISLPSETVPEKCVDYTNYDQLS